MILPRSDQLGAGQPAGPPCPPEGFRVNLWEWNPQGLNWVLHPGAFSFLVTR